MGTIGPVQRRAGGLAASLLMQPGPNGCQERTAVIGYGGFGLLLALFAGSRSFPLSLALIGAAYAMESLYEANLHTMVQTAVPDRMRGYNQLPGPHLGRYGLLRLHTGAVARRLGAPVAIAIGGVVVFANAARLATGALPPAAGVATASHLLR